MEQDEIPGRGEDSYSYRMDSYFSLCVTGMHNRGVQMGRKKNKKEIKGFPGYDLHLTVIIIIGMMTLGLIKTCNG